MTANPGIIHVGEMIRPLIPHLDQYFGLWAMNPDRMVGMAERIRLSDLGAHIAAVKAQPTTSSIEYQITDGVAVIQIAGTLMKYGSSAADGTSTIQIRRQLRLAARDKQAKSIMLVIDSPGGSVAGTQDLANEVARAAESKAVVAFIEDLGASAAYWVASQATKIYANESGQIGSIGVFAVVEDMSQAAADMGVKVMVFRSGDYKGAGVPGDAITEAQAADFQRMVTEFFGLFSKAVRAGRGMDAKDFAAVADGRVWLAQDAKALGLIDGIKTYDQAVGLAANMRPRRPATLARKEEKAMAENEDGIVGAAEDKPKRATIQELRAACPGADAEWLLAQVEVGATLAQAQTRWSGEQVKRIEAQVAELEQSQKELAEAKTRTPLGVKPVAELADGGSTAAPEDPIAAWNAALEKELATGTSRHQAVININRRDPALREAYVEAYNAAHSTR